ncbi:protein-L-isoaspartate O-methyltransferase [Niveomyces insectorum RCEF 264]|uniref:protein-L-isoaspartate(D-aspartate) O-methyltransferase n=1 Tax=Niveomyces insectorum RCEF 264 TaxID=1081102 RepID=A0A167SNJ3_9HYPO|nr:protein-L-isoaspartate O-methyltransferase [Niveomyces insectorum RCEF 264]
MAWRSSGATNADLVENLCRHKMIDDARVKAAFLSVDRAHYTDYSPYVDAPQSIGYGVTISAPHMHAFAIQHLMPYLVPDAAAGRPAPRVLDIGSGSGYLTHVFAELAGEHGRVLGVEHIPQLRDQAEQNMAKSAAGRQFLASKRVAFVVGDGRLGAPRGAADTAPFDAIHVGASAAELPQALLDQLRSPGRMFIPLDDTEAEYAPAFPGDPRDQHVWTIDKAADGTVTRTKLFGVRYVPLTDAPGGATAMEAK